MTESLPYEITVYDKEGLRLSLSPEPGEPEIWRAQTVFSAVSALACVPAMGVIHFEVAEGVPGAASAQIARIELRHLQDGVRRLLETLTRC